MYAVEFLKEKNRMMLSDLKSYNELQKMPTVQCVVAYVSNWSIEHPKKTRLQDFLEKYPNADTFEDGTPKVCASILGYCEKCAIVGDYSRDCDDCWNEPVE